MNVVMLNGSPAQGSRTRACLEYIAEQFKAQGVRTEIIDLLNVTLPINDPSHHHDASKHPDENVRTLAKQVENAEIVVLATPLYHGSYSGLLKVALDNLDGDAFAGKKVIIMSQASGMRGSMQAAHELEIVPRTMAGDVYGRLIGTCKDDYGMVDGKSTLTSDEIRNRVEQIVSEITS